jgi:hypothetical protein
VALFQEKFKIVANRHKFGTPSPPKTYHSYEKEFQKQNLQQNNLHVKNCVTFNDFLSKKLTNHNFVPWFYY